MVGAPSARNLSSGAPPPSEQPPLGAAYFFLLQIPSDPAAAAAQTLYREWTAVQRNMMSPAHVPPSSAASDSPSFGYSVSVQCTKPAQCFAAVGGYYWLPTAGYSYGGPVYLYEFSAAALWRRAAVSDCNDPSLATSNFR